ncbi:MAG: DNA methyltransferase [Chloroflexi bacterium]|nr:DNA methyltransferase [Chloroflexota bacterium]
MTPTLRPRSDGITNWRNRTIWTGDNLAVMRGMNSNSVDLIYLDPPFNSNRNYSAPIGSEAAGAAFKDTWTLDDVDLAEHGEIADRNPALYKVIDAAGDAHGKGMKSYLIMMGTRLLEMRRLLKDSGSIYLHCDDAANYWLRAIMDAVFGSTNFRNDITWKRTSAHNDPKRYGRITDTIFFYTKTDQYTWNIQHTDYSQEYIGRFFRHEDERGRYKAQDLTAAGASEGDSGAPWRGYNPTGIGRHWSVPRRIVRNLAGEEGLKLSIQERLDLLDEHGYIHIPKRGNHPSYKSYLKDLPGARVQNLWGDINRVESQAKERLGYPTQKPLALLKRIIAASSNPDDVVLDPFCGCATACIAAEQLDRQWVGIDLSPLAAALVLRRAENEIGSLFAIDHRTDIPRRTDLGKLPNYRTHKHTLYGLQEGVCAGCQVHFPFRNLTVDHKTPRSRGGGDHFENLQLLCGACNSAKGDGTMAELLARLNH